MKNYCFILKFLSVFFVIFDLTAAEIFVNRTSCSLGNAIRSANQDTSVGGCSAGSGADVITVGNTNNSGSISFAAPVFGTRTALPVITSDITVEPSTGSLTLSRSAFSSQFYRIFEVAEDGSLTLNQVNVLDGDLSDINDISSSGQGGGIRSLGRLNLNSVTVRGNRAARGGGVYLGGKASTTITNSDIQVNFSNGFGGGIFASGSVNLGDSSLEVSDTSIRFNLSGSSFGVGAGQGGGLYLSPQHRTKLIRTSITRNQALKGEDETSFVSSGGGIGLQPSGSLQVLDSTISNNLSNSGCAVTAFRDVTFLLINTTISDNTAQCGSAISLDLDSSSFTMRNSILSGNGENNAGRELRLSSPDIADFIDIRNNIIGNAEKTTAEAISLFNTSQTPQQLFTDTLIATSDAGQATALRRILNPLSSQGGLLESHSLPQGSPAIDNAIENTSGGEFPFVFITPGCRGESFGLFGVVDTNYRTDQLGNTRPMGAGCDIGAIEAEPDDSSFFVIPLRSGKAVIFSL